jgi:hypothetical protein
MKGRFARERLPVWPEYANTAGLELVGSGTWRTTACTIHGGSDSLRVNTLSGGWLCMNCRASGGDVLSHYMQVHGLDFADAARALGAWVEDGKPDIDRPRRLSATDCLRSLERDLNACVVVISDARRGTLPNDEDWIRFLQAAGRVGAIATEAAR